MTLLSLDRVSVHRGARAVVHEVSLEIAENEVVGLLGPNGAGKSTLLRVALGMVARTRGEVRVGSLDPASADRRALAKLAVLLPERAGSGSGLSVREVVRTGRFAHVGAFGAENERDRAAVDGSLDTLRLRAMETRSFDTLSAGERKRVLLARCFAQEAPLFLLDEPTSTLDLGHAKSLFDSVRERVKTQGAALVAIHDLGLAAAVCDRLALMHEGRIVAIGSSDDVLSEKNVYEVFGARASVERDEVEVRVRIPR